jgi:hypothetical protein
MSYNFSTTKMFIAFKHKYTTKVLELAEFKSQPFYTPERFGEVIILDFAYINSNIQLKQFKNQFK